MKSSKYLHGKPFGDCAILHRRSFTSHAAPLNSCSKRFCPVILTDHRGTSTPFIRVCLPFCDSCAYSIYQFLTILGELVGYDAQHNYDYLLIAGNFNRNSVSLHHLHSFMSDLNLVSADLSYQSSIYMRDDGTTSWSNHYLCDSPRAMGKISIWLLVNMRFTRNLIYNAIF